MDSLLKTCVQHVGTTWDKTMDNVRQSIHNIVPIELVLCSNGYNSGLSTVYPHDVSTGYSTGTIVLPTGVAGQLSPLSTVPIITIITYIIRRNTE